MALQRWEMYRVILESPICSRSDNLCSFLTNRYNLAQDKTREVRKCASRFVSEFNTRWQKCARKKNVFETQYESWLNGVSCVPQNCMYIIYL